VCQILKGCPTGGEMTGRNNLKYIRSQFFCILKKIITFAPVLITINYETGNIFYITHRFAADSRPAVNRFALLQKRTAFREFCQKRFAEILLRKKPSGLLFRQGFKN
jgi:hypothetical protein